MIPPHRRLAACPGLLALCALLLGASAFAAEKLQTLEAEEYKPKAATAYTDGRASGGKCVIAPLPAGGRVFEATQALPPGDYVATAWLEVVPAGLVHTLAVTFQADAVVRIIDQAQLDAQPGFRPYQLRFFHPGGKVALSLEAAGKTGFEQMKASPGDGEKGGAAVDIDESTSGKKKKENAAQDELSELLEGARSAQSFGPGDLRVACDRVELTLLHAAPVTVSSVSVDKVHYAPLERVQAKAELLGGAAGGAFTLRAEVVTEFNDTRPVYSSPVQLASGEKKGVSFEFPLTAQEFGHELRCQLIGADGAVVHSASEYFGVSANVYRVGITGRNVGQSTRGLTLQRAEAVMAENQRQYANYFERFAWAPCDYSDLTPKTAEYVSGQTQYPGSVAGQKLEIATAHRHGIQAISYGKACAAGIAGFATYQRHPEFFGHTTARGPVTEQMSTFLLERMLENDYNFNKPSEGGWRHWASLWTRFDHNPTVDFGADELVRSAQMFGWNGVRWDGHFVGNQARCIERINAQRPGYVHGYNSAFANCGSPLFLPPDQTDFHTIAKGHGLIMDESVRGHSRYTNGSMRDFYEGICREADYVKRIGGLPLFITFDMGSKQDVTWNVLFGLAGGQRYTYLTSPGDYAFGPLPKFLTRYSSFIWDDTSLIAKPGEQFQVTLPAGTSAAAEPWWDQSAWLRRLPDGREQVLLHVLNVPGYRNFAQRVQTPPTWRQNVGIKARLPAGAKLKRAFHVSPDLVDGAEMLTMKTEAEAVSLTLPVLKLWSIVVLEFEPGATQPLYPLTQPVEAATAHLADEAQKKAHQEKLTAEREAAGIGATAAKSPLLPHADFSREYNADTEVLAGDFKSFARPEKVQLQRNGILDVHHARGAFAWLNPIDVALPLAGGGSYAPSWVDRVGFKLGPGGSMEDFPDSYEQLLANDVLVLDDVHAVDLGAQRRTMIVDFVRAGGGLLVMGGSFNLSQGADRNSALAELLPVRIEKPDNIATERGGLPLAAVKADFFPRVDWTRAGSAFQLDLSPVKAGAEVLATAGGHPAIVASQYGAGRVIVVLVNPHGDPAPGAKPYWEAPEWPRILAACLAHLGQGSKAVSTSATKTRKLDPKHVQPDDLMLEASNLAGPELAKRLRSARENMIDAESARTVLRVALDNWSKISDVEAITDVVECAGPFIDESFAPLGVQLAQSDLDVLRSVGYRVLGFTRSKDQRGLLEKGLLEQNAGAARSALLALAQIGDPAVAPAVASYASRPGAETLLAYSVLRRLGAAVDFKGALEAYAHGLRRITELHSGRKSVLNTLYGGMSFSLTPAARRSAQNELRTVKEEEARARQDTAYFAENFDSVSAPELKVLTEYLRTGSNAALAPFAYAAFQKLPKAETQPLRAQLAESPLPQIRVLAND